MAHIVESELELFSTGTVGRYEIKAQDQSRQFKTLRLCVGDGWLFIISLIGHWLFGWLAYVQEQQAHHQQVTVSEYLIVMTRDTLENWQSEFLQLIWQVAGLALLLHVGSPQSKEGDDRMEAKLDAILLAIDQGRGKETIEKIDASYEGRDTDTIRAERIAEKQSADGG